MHTARAPECCRTMLTRSHFGRRSRRLGIADRVSHSVGHSDHQSRADQTETIAAPWRKAGRRRATGPSVGRSVGDLPPLDPDPELPERQSDRTSDAVPRTRVKAALTSFTSRSSWILHSSLAPHAQQLHRPNHHYKRSLLATHHRHTVVQRFSLQACGSYIYPTCPHTCWREAALFASANPTLGRRILSPPLSSQDDLSNPLAIISSATHSRDQLLFDI